MQVIFSSVRDVTLLSVFLRLSFASISGGIIGAERELKRRSAGFRTHILICLGATMAAVTGQFLCVYMNYYTDMTRLGAQVISGIGFIGAGAIITTPRHHVKGLTTSAGLWASGIIGLCYGAGFFEGGITATFLVVVSEIFLSRIEYRLRSYGKYMNLYIEYLNKDNIDTILQIVKEENASIENLELGRASVEEKGKKVRSAIMQLRVAGIESKTIISDRIKSINGIVIVEAFNG